MAGLPQLYKYSTFLAILLRTHSLQSLRPLPTLFRFLHRLKLAPAPEPLVRLALLIMGAEPLAMQEGQELLPAQAFIPRIHTEMAMGLMVVAAKANPLLLLWGQRSVCSRSWLVHSLLPTTSEITIGRILLAIASIYWGAKAQKTVKALILPARSQLRVFSAKNKFAVARVDGFRR